MRVAVLLHSLTRSRSLLASLLVVLVCAQGLALVHRVAHAELLPQGLAETRLSASSVPNLLDVMLGHGAGAECERYDALPATDTPVAACAPAVTFFALGVAPAQRLEYPRRRPPSAERPPTRAPPLA